MTTTSIASPQGSTFSYISNLVREKAAIILDEQKTYLIESRLAPIVREHELDSLDHLVAELKKPTARALTQAVVEAMTTNETSFYRDLHPFNALKEHLIPELLQKRESARQLTIWSNACSTGQEAYSIAMLLKDNFPQLDAWNVKIIATDICSKVLNRAKSGEFNQTEVNRGLPMQLLMKYFTRDGMKWTISDEIRRMVDFRLLNLVEPWPLLPRVDIVFLRNVLIYFNVETKTEILTNVQKKLAPDGYLFLGGAETTMNLNVNYKREQHGNAVYYRPAES